MIPWREGRKPASPPRAAHRCRGRTARPARRAPARWSPPECCSAAGGMRQPRALAKQRSSGAHPASACGSESEAEPRMRQEPGTRKPSRRAVRQTAQGSLPGAASSAVQLAQKRRNRRMLQRQRGAPRPECGSRGRSPRRRAAPGPGGLRVHPMPQRRRGPGCSNKHYSA